MARIITTATPIPSWATIITARPPHARWSSPANPASVKNSARSRRPRRTTTSISPSTGYPTSCPNSNKCCSLRTASAWETWTGVTTPTSSRPKFNNSNNMTRWHSWDHPRRSIADFYPHRHLNFRIATFSPNKVGPELFPEKNSCNFRGKISQSILLQH